MNISAGGEGEDALETAGKMPALRSAAALIVMRSRY